MNTYQAVIATDGVVSYVLFLYRDVQWSRAQTNIGFNAGDAIRSFTVPEPSSGDFYFNIERDSNIGIPGSFFFRVDQEFIVEPSSKYVL